MKLKQPSSKFYNKEVDRFDNYKLEQNKLIDEQNKI